ncbi:hypothetical protein [Spirosoma telluris]|uniref:hypothetical protein n=1 Tax=Spirosoma telluris TaxID=2183553 RepID=UPI002FC393E7
MLVALHLSNEYAAELRDFLDVVQQNQVMPAELLLFSTDGPATQTDVLRQSLAIIRHELPQIRIGAGTNYNFTELNRNRFPTNGLNFISYAVHPQAHAFDNRSMVENLAGQGDTVRTAQSFCGLASVQVSPVTLRHRLNPDARDPANRILSNTEKIDPRQPSLWAAGWTLGSIKALAEAGAKSVTYYQTVGKQGIISEDAQLYPLAVVLAQVLEFQGGQVIPTKVNHPLACSCLLLVQSDHRRWLLANHTDQPLSVQLPEPVRRGYRITPMPASIVPVELTDTQHISVEPFGVWVLEC